jgi:hypothetical protein
LNRSTMQKIEKPTSPAPAPAPYTLRSHRPGDIGWIIHRQGVLYYEEYGWDERFEALVAEICARFIQNEDPADRTPAPRAGDRRATSARGPGRK